MREAGPVVYFARYDLWALGRYEDVRTAFSDWRTYSSAAGTGLTHIRRAGNWRRPSLILENDPPDHGRYRKIFAKVLTGAVLQEIRDRFAQAADETVRALVARGTFDAQRELADPFPFLVIPALLGVPEQHRGVMLAYAELSFNAQGPNNELLRQSRARAAPIIDDVMRLCRRENLAADGLGARLYREADTAGVNEEDAATLVRTFFSASLDTTINGIGFTIRTLATLPNQWARLRQQPGLAGAAFDEALRLDSPSPYIVRTSTRDVTVHGVAIPADSKVLLLVGAANRDPIRFEDPDRFDMDRSPGHLAFGFGIHACIGQMVTKLEAEIVLEALARHARTLRLVGPCAGEAQQLAARSGERASRGNSGVAELGPGDHMARGRHAGCPKACSCSSQQSGIRLVCTSCLRVSAAGWRPSTIAEMMLGER